MQKIIRIARLELSILFYSPIAWLVLIIFTIQSGVTFTEMLYSQETMQQLERKLSVLTRVLFAGESGVLSVVQQNLYLYIPLLTMGLLSRETSSGSIKLLLSSPVTVSQIVFGKFLAMMIYALILVLILLGFTLTGHLSVVDFDTNFVLGGIFGLYLLICAYVAIGLFMSSLTAYQVVAAISTLAVLASLNFIGEIGQETDFVRDITYWLSMSGRSEQMINGLITSKDVLYFILVVAFFIVLTVIKLNAGRQVRSVGFKIIRYAVLILVVIGIGYLTSMPALTGYLDTTRLKDRTLADSSQLLVKRIVKPLKIVSYTNVMHYTAAYGAPKNRISDIRQFEKYQRFLPDMKMEYVAYYDTVSYNSDTTKSLVDKAKKAADALGFNFKKLLTPQQIRKQFDPVPEENGFVRMVEYNGKKTPLRMYNDQIRYPMEAEINAALLRLLEVPATAGMLTGNEERSANKHGDRGYQAITRGLDTRPALINQGYNVVDIDVNQKADLPDSLTVLIVADPTVAFSPVQLQKLRQYLDKGGNMLIAGEPGRQEMLNPLLAQLDIKMMPGTLLEESDNYELDLIQGGFSLQAEDYKLAAYEGAIVSMPGAAGLSYGQVGAFKKQTILLSNAKSSWNKLGTFDLKNKIVFDQKTEKKAAYPLAIAVTRSIGKKEQKIMVLGDADFMSNVEMIRNNLNTVNSSFVIKTMKWFSNGIYPVATTRPKSTDTVILVSRSGINMQKLFFLGIIPMLIGVWGSMLLIRRKRK